MNTHGAGKILSVVSAAMLIGGCSQINGLMGKKEPTKTANTPTTAAENQGGGSDQASSPPFGAAAPKQTSDYTRATKSESASGIYGDIPDDSPFAKIKVGMSSREVIDLIGPPTDQKTYVSGKAFIPFYYGHDRSRSEFRYKGLGVITFAGGGGFSSTYTVSRVIYNPKEAGYER